MPQHDYVKRSKAPQRNKKNSKQNHQDTAKATGLSIKVKLLIVITLIAIVGFAAGLWFLMQQPKQVVVSKPAQQKTVELPAPPKEKWSYRELLKNKEVEQGHYEVTQKGPYKMQCGSFRKASQAQELKAKIAFAGIESQVKSARGKTGLWYKVVLGPYQRKRLAEADKHKLKRNGVNGCQIWLWQ